MGAITQKIFDLLSEGSNIEQSRSTGIIIKSNWFNAIDGDDELSLPGSGTDQKTDSLSDKERSWKTINDIP